jgi:hypothetical protein
MTVAKEILKKIRAIRRGKPFQSSDFLELGSRAAVDQALWRLVNAGDIKRIKRGMFVKPERHAYAGEVLPGAEEVAKFLARQSGNKVEVNGADAARRFGFTTQVSSQSVFLTDGPTQKYRLGNQEVRLKHVAPRKVALAGSPAGEALSALWYLGSDEVTPRTFERLEARLPGREFSKLEKKQNIMPGWMRDALNEYQRNRQVG